MFRLNFIKWVAGGSAAIFLLVLLLTSPLIIKPLYESATTIYVPLTLFSRQYEQLGVGFGNNEEIDAHIQILSSTRILDSLDAVFSLSERLGVDMDDPGGRSRYYRVAGNRITTEKTRYGSVSVRVRDKDRIYAAEMANRIVALGDLIKEDILLENRLAAYNFARELYMEKLEETLEMERQIMGQGAILPLQRLKTGTADISPAEIFGHAEAEEADDVTPGALRQLTTYESELWNLTSLKNDYERVRKSLETPIPRSYVVSPAVVAENPAWPPRLLLAVAAVIAFVIIMVFVRIVRMD
ncbi:MAG: hypothetical protein EA408_00850 [Marinilabiliales bacterium]|nr:MAG: hypothetical protein EA408_00850 [Marinilabiliales bacterium]